MLLLGIVTLLLNMSECLRMTVRPDKDATVTVSSSLFLPLEQCSVCTVSGAENDTQTACHSSLTLVPDEDVTLLFNCTEPPQSAFVILIHRKIECTNDTCSPAAGAAQPSLFSEFIRTLVWGLSVPEKTVLSLDFPGDRLKEMTESELCQDGYQYTVTRTSTEGEVKTQTYCRNGLVAHLHIPSQATVSLQVQKGREVDSSVFTATAKPIKKQSRMISVTPEPDTIVTISRDTKAKECSVCVGEGPTCNPKELVLRTARNTSVKFTCPQPQDVFSVQINREIDCTEIACTGNIVQAESSLFPDFNRSFTWDLKVPPGLAFQLDFPSPGMRQIPPSETCPDEHTYTIITYQRTGPTTIGIFCPDGTITTVQVLYKGRVSLQVPGDRKLEPLDFKVTVGPEIKMLAVVKANLPRGVSDTDFFSANYPRGFPDDDLMRWDFTVPGMHNYTVNFLNHTESFCRKKEVMVMYHKAHGKVGIQKTLVDTQPTHRQGSFTMTLFNCETDRTKPGLSLNFRVSVMRSGHPVVCTVNPSEEEGPVLHIEKRGSDPYCEMRKNSVIQEKITVPSGTKARLSFLDCPSEDLRLTARKTIGCQSLDSCSVSGTLLTVPKMPTCLPTLLQSFTWHLIIPVYGTVDLLSPTGNLRQSLPGQECNGSVSLHVAEGDGSSIGYFCSEGSIRKVQVHSNVSVTATAKDLSLIQGPFLNVSFSEKISDSIIYTVQPRMGSPALLATPNWPSGMKPYSTVSWIINLPGHLQADLLLTNISQPKCGQGHTFIKVQTLGSPEEILSRREDKESEDKLMVPESFYLNMSNCMPEDGHFSVLSKVTLQKTSKLLMSGILGAVGAVLLLMIIVLTVVCLVLRKKKRKMVNEASIYIGKGNIFIPGDSVFPKSRSDNESHVYASIEDTMVYSHLLREPSYVGTIQDHFQGQPVDTYRTFMALQDGVPEITETAADHEPELVPEKDMYRSFLDPSETFIPSRPRTPIDRQDSMGFMDRRMVDNELYTFKSTGDINTIRLSGANQILDPETIDSEGEESI
ncbi:CUB domain-containing protein 1-like [Coregonus clupeaformis]|uniref:CUB domain-containing protein 1-like n=1 Tax=Coregonus suidteri TaxID=861788 RepID=A0AAN8NAU7_9TELE|nr:CUB domain-containing protein 1-like [Coregonus clupeaformis]XP_041738846.1 CUB domain-containing protein 1-like [Coregonus clupeaformis]